ncbi:MAG: hypothetical protein V3T70_10105, partial [Phycisphaerae bacterium]
LLHPFVPFITEAIHEEIGKQIPRHYELLLDDADLARIAAGESIAATPLITATWPKMHAPFSDETCDRDVNEVIRPIIIALRQARTEINTVRSKAKQPAIKSLPQAVIRADEALCSLVATSEALIQRLGAVEQLAASPVAEKPHRVRAHVADGFELYVPLADLVDLAIEEKRLQGELKEKQAALSRAQSQLANEGFVTRAAPEAVEQTRQRAADLQRQCTLIEQHLADLK